MEGEKSWKVHRMGSLKTGNGTRKDWNQSLTCHWIQKVYIIHSGSDNYRCTLLLLILNGAGAFRGIYVFVLQLLGSDIRQVRKEYRAVNGTGDREEQKASK